jgi:hypothetical protein
MFAALDEIKRTHRMAEVRKPDPLDLGSSLA